MAKKVKIEIGADVSEAKATISQFEEFTKKSFKDQAKAAEKSGQEISNAYKKMGIRTEKAISKSSDDARRHYQKIKNSGTASANDIKRAHTSMTQKIKRNNREMGEGTSSLSRLFKTLKSNIFAIVATIVGAGFAIKKALDFTERGAKLEVQRKAFHKFTESMGADSDDVIAKLKEISRNTIATSDLIKSAGTALLLGLEPKKIFKLLEIARASAKITGESVAKQFEDIAKGTGRASRLILDNLGIMFSQGKANEAVAESLGKLVSELTDAEKRQGNLNEVIRAGSVIVASVGEDYDSTADKIARFRVKFKEMTDGLAVFAAVVFDKIEPSLRELGKGFLLLGKIAVGIKDLLKLPFDLTDLLVDRTFAIFGIKRETKATEELAKAKKKVVKVEEEAGENAKQRKKRIKEETDAIKKNLKVELEALKEKERQQRSTNTLIKIAIQETRQELRELQREVEMAAAFTQSIIASFEASRRTASQRGLDPVEVLIDNLKFAASDFAEAQRQFAAGNVDAAKDLTRSAADAINALKTADIVAFQEAGFSPAGFDDAVESAGELQDKIVKFAEVMDDVARDKIPAVAKELEDLEAQLAAGKGTLNGIIQAIKDAKTLAQELKDKLSEDTTSTHTTIMKTVQTQATGGPVQPIKAQTGKHFPGYGGGDKIPILGEAGEFMMRKEAVKGFGLAAAHAFNNRDLAGLLDSLNVPVQRLKEGGSVQSPGPSETMKLELAIAGKSLNTTASKSEAGPFIKNLKRLNIIHSRGQRPY